MYTKQGEVGRSRRRHGAEFKGKVLAECRQPGVSIAAVAGASPPIMVNSDDLVAAANIFKMLLVSTVLGPMASATCELDRAHPLCQMPDS